MSKFDQDKANKPKQLTDKTVNNLDNLRANTINLNDILQTFEEKSKEDIKIKPKNNKFTKFRSGLNQQQKFLRKSYN